jgi:hypothetical protein
VVVGGCCEVACVMYGAIVMGGDSGASTNMYSCQEKRYS